MKPRLPALLRNALSLSIGLGLALAALPAFAQTAPTHITTTKKSAIAIGSGSFALVKGTKLEVVARDGDTLVVKYRTSQGKIPLADTDYPADAAAAAEAAPAEAPAKPLPAVAQPTATVKPAPAKATPPPALDPTGKPATNYGKAVQKARQVTETHKSTHVDPTKDIMDEEPKKK